MLAFLVSCGMLYHEERKIVMVSAPTSPREIDKLRAEHQAKAKLAAEAGLVPKAFLGDPTFEELMSAQGVALPEPTAEFYHGILARAKIDESTNDSG